MATDGIAALPFNNTLYGYANFLASKTSVGRNEIIVFQAVVPPTAIGVFWDFGDGTTSNSTAPLKSYSTQGTYRVRMYVYDAYGRCNSCPPHAQAFYVTVSNSITAFPLDSGFSFTYNGVTYNMSGTPKQAFSFRQLSATATLCCRIRRSSDNSELDFGFTNQGYLDVAGLSSFLNGSTGFIRTWYDQSGFADYAQTTVTLQPQIDISGTYAKAIFILGSSVLTSAITLQFGPARNFVQNTLAAIDSAANNDSNPYNVVSVGTSGGAFVRIFNTIGSGAVFWSSSYNMGSGGTGINAVASVAKGAWSSLTHAHDTASKVYFMFNSNLQNPGGSAVSNDTNQNVNGPAINQNAGTPQYNHWIRESIMIMGTTDYSYIDAAQKAYYTDRL